MNPRVLSVKPMHPFRLLLTFDSGEQRIFDVAPYLDIGIFKELTSDGLFYSARAVDGSVQWQNEADFCPDTLYLGSHPVKETVE